MESYPLSMRYLSRLLLTFTIIAVLIIAKTLLVPLFFAILFAYLLYPAANKLESWNVPRILTNLILIVSSLAVIAGIIYLIVLLTIMVTDNLADIQEHIDTNITRLRWALGRTFGVTAEQLDGIINSIKSSGQYISTFFKGTITTVFTVALVPVYTFMILFYRDKFQSFITKLVPEERYETTQNIIAEASNIVPKYMKGLFIVFFLMVILNSLGFYLVGIKYALLLGIIAAVCNLIPYLGTVIGYGIVLLLVLATQTPGLALAVIVQFFVVQFIENNILTPNITGSYVDINPLVTLLSIIAGGMIWGLPGMFMVIPYLALLKIVCENVDDLKPVGYLLGNRGTERHSISVDSLKKMVGWK